MNLNEKERNCLQGPNEHNSRHFVWYIEEKKPNYYKWHGFTVLRAFYFMNRLVLQYSELHGKKFTIIKGKFFWLWSSLSRPPSPVSWYSDNGFPPSLSLMSFYSRGRILGRKLDIILTSFPPCYSQSPLLTDFTLPPHPTWPKLV